MRGLTVLFWTLIFTTSSVELMKIQAAADKCAYALSPPNGTPDIYVIDAKGGKPTLRAPGSNSPPAWGKGPLRFAVDP